MKVLRIRFTSAPTFFVLLQQSSYKNIRTNFIATVCEYERLKFLTLTFSHYNVLCYCFSSTVEKSGELLPKGLGNPKVILQNVMCVLQV